MTQVIAVYILVIEKARTSAISQSSISSALGIPFAGFVVGTVSVPFIW